MEFTGERLVPDKPEFAELYQHHILRYIFSKPFARGKVVLDAACGAGYGTYYLARNEAVKAVGVDISEEAVAYAKEVYGRENAEFQVMDVAAMTFPDNTFDVVCSFETIEHVPDYEAFLSEAKRVLKPGGVFIVSTPNEENYVANTEDGDNPFHVREFTLDEFKGALNKSFQNVNVLYQHSVAPVKVDDLDYELSLCMIELLLTRLRGIRFDPVQGLSDEVIGEQIKAMRNAVFRVNSKLPGILTKAVRFIRGRRDVEAVATAVESLVQSTRHVEQLTRERELFVWFSLQQLIEQLLRDNDLKMAQANKNAGRNGDIGLTEFPGRQALSKEGADTALYFVATAYKET